MWKTLVLILIVVGASLLFILRGPVRSLKPYTGSADFAVVYAAARAWYTGQNPYDYETLTGVLRDSGYPRSRRPHPTVAPAVYPPATFVVLAPFALAPWSAAMGAWLAVNLAAVAALLWAIATAMGFVRAGPQMGLLTAGVLALASLQTGIALGQLALVPTMLVALAMVLDDRRHHYVAGVLAALAAVLKPHVGGVLMVFLLLRICRGRLKTLMVATGLVALLTVVGVVRLHDSGVDWRSELQGNIHDFTHDGIGDPTRSNNLAYQLINLQVPLHVFTDHRAAVNLMVYLSVLGAAMVGFFSARRSAAPDGDWLLLSILAVLSLLVVPHRHYDAVLVSLPLAWCIKRVSRRRDLWAWAALIMLAAFLTPGGALVWEVSRSWGLSEAITGAWWWRFIVLSHQTWALCGLVICLLTSLWSTARSGRACVSVACIT